MELIKWHLSAIKNFDEFVKKSVLDRTQNRKKLARGLQDKVWELLAYINL